MKRLTKLKYLGTINQQQKDNTIKTVNSNFEKLDKVDKFLENYKLSKLKKDNTGTTNRPVTAEFKETES